MPITELKCPKCAAPISPNNNCCEYCKAFYAIGNDAIQPVENPRSADPGINCKATDEVLKTEVDYHRRKLTHKAMSNGNFHPNIISELVEDLGMMMVSARNALRKKNGEIPTLKEVYNLTFAMRNDPRFMSQWRSIKAGSS